MKKLLTLIVVALIVVPVLAFSGVTQAANGAISPTPAFSDIAGHPAETALTVLGSLGVFTGSYGLGGAVDPNGALTREAFCKVVVVAKGLQTQADMMKNMQPPFSDSNQISSWAWGYVNVAVNQNIIGGFPDGTFQAKTPVTYAQAIKMLVCAIPGHKAMTNPALGWPNQYVFYGVTNGFTGDVSPDPNANCTRGDMARMLFATMLIDPLKGDGTPDAGKAILHNLGANPNYWTGTFGGESGGSFTVSTWMGFIPLANTVYVLGASSYAELTGTDVECVAKADGKVVFIRRVAGTSNVGTLTEISSDAEGDYIILDKSKKFYYTSPVPVTLNTSVGPTDADLAVGDYVTVNTNASGLMTAATAIRYDMVRCHILLNWVAVPWDALASVTPASGSTPAGLTFPADSPYFYYNRNTSNNAPLAGVTLQVGSGATVKINGSVATPNSLQEGDIIKVATVGAKGYQDANSIVAISATRNIVDGTVVTNTTSYPGPVNSVIMNVGGATQTYERFSPTLFGCYLHDPLVVGQRYQLAINENGVAFYSIGFTTTNPIVYVKQTILSGTTKQLVVDNQGVEQTLVYTGPVDPSVIYNHFALLTIDGSTGVVTSIGPGPLEPATDATVASATATNVTLQSVPPGTVWFGNAPPCVVYRKTGTTYTYIGTAGLTTGTAVHVYLDGGTPLVILWEP